MAALVEDLVQQQPCLQPSASLRGCVGIDREGRNRRAESGDKLADVFLRAGVKSPSSAVAWVKARNNLRLA